MPCPAGPALAHLQSFCDIFWYTLARPDMNLKSSFMQSDTECSFTASKRSAIGVSSWGVVEATISAGKAPGWQVGAFDVQLSGCDDGWCGQGSLRSTLRSTLRSHLMVACHVQVEADTQQWLGCQLRQLGRGGRSQWTWLTVMLLFSLCHVRTSFSATHIWTDSQGLYDFDSLWFRQVMISTGYDSL